MKHRAPADHRRRHRDRLRALAGPVVEALEGRLLLHVAGSVQGDEHVEVFGTLANGVITGGLVPDSSVTIKSVSVAGNTSPLPWGTPSSWITVPTDPNAAPVNRVPQAGDNVVITAGTTVLINGNEEAINADGSAIVPDPLVAVPSANTTAQPAGMAAALHTIRVDGTLAFATNANTKLLVDTIVVEPSGTYRMGTSDSPIQQGFKADVIFSGGTPIDTSWDPYEFSRGLLTHGSVSIYGQTVTNQVSALSALPAPAIDTSAGNTAIPKGTKQIILSSLPTDWNKGDRLIITGDTASNSSGVNQDEQVAIQNIVPYGNNQALLTITDVYNSTTGTGNLSYKGLAYEHDAPAGQSIYVADVARNAVFESQTPGTVAQRGHIMFMHNANVHVSGAGFYGLGRTDKRNPINDPNPVADPRFPIDPNDDDAHLTDDIIDTVDWNPQMLVPVLDAGGHAVLDPSKPVLDAGGHAVMVPVLDKNGNPVKVNGVVKLVPALVPLMQAVSDPNAHIPIDRVLEPVHDAAGNSVPLVGPDGSEVLLLDSSGHPIPVHDLNGNPVVDSNGKPVYQIQYQLQIARSGTNPRGRYAVHLHRTGTDPGSTQASIFDSAVVDSPGWGIVNHSSNVDVEQNVVYNALGAAYVTEAGDELGQFVGNIAIHGQGAGGGIEDRKEIGDFGQLGDGFWLQGGNVTLTNNIATGMRHSGYVFFPVGLDQKGLGVTQIAFNTLDPKVQAAMLIANIDLQAKLNATAAATAAAAAAIPPGTPPPPVMVADGDVPLRGFTGNVAAADGDGFESWFSLLNFSDATLGKIASAAASLPTPAPIPQLQSVVSNFSVWNSGGGLFDPYTNSLKFQNVKVLGNLKSLYGTAFNRNDVTRNISYVDLDVRGWTTAINMPVNGAYNLVQGGTYDNAKDLLITTANSNRVVNINDSATDPLVFPDTIGSQVLPAGVVNPLTKLGQTLQYHIYLQPNYNPMDGDLTRLFSKDVIQIGTVTYNNLQLYYVQQAADFAPFAPGDTSVPDFIPIELREQLDASGNPILVNGNPVPMTNAMMFAKYGLAVGGAVAPSDAKQSDPHINALIGSHASYLPELQLQSAKYVTLVASPPPPYYLAYRYYDPVKAAYVSVNNKKTLTATPLHNGWNVIPIVANGTPRALLVYGDATPPSFTLTNPSGPTTINQSDITLGTSILIQGKITDDSLGPNGSKDFRQTFKLGGPNFSPVTTRPDGSKFTTLSFTIKDFAGNTFLVQIFFDVTDQATLVLDQGRKYVPTIKVSLTLAALMTSNGL
jgi:hypothetical protein